MSLSGLVTVRLSGPSFPGRCGAAARGFLGQERAGVEKGSHPLRGAGAHLHPRTADRFQSGTAEPLSLRTLRLILLLCSCV